MEASSAASAVHRRVFDSIVDAVGDTATAAAIEIGKRRENAGKTVLAIVPPFPERHLSTILFEGI